MSLMREVLLYSVQVVQNAVRQMTSQPRYRGVFPKRRGEYVRESVNPSLASTSPARGSGKLWTVR